MVNAFARVTGGTDRQALSLARGLRERGHEVRFLSTASAENLETEGAFVPLLVSHATREHLSVGEQARVLRSTVWNRAAASAMRRLVEDFEPDVVHAHKLYPQLSVAPIVVARRAGVPVVQTLHDYQFVSASAYDTGGSRVDRREERLRYRLLNTATFPIRRYVHARAVTEWIAVSDFVAAVHGRRLENVTTIPNFADVPAERALPREARSGVLFLGALSREKGVLDVLEVARRLSEVPFVIAGSGPLEELVATEAARLPNVEFRGRLDAVSALAATLSASLLVTPSGWAEPGALVSLEAMAAGTPLVAYPAGGLGEYVSRSGAGLVVDADPRALAEGCETLLEDAGLWGRCSDAGLEATKTVFGRDAHLEAVLGVYDRAVRAMSTPGRR